MYLNEVDGYADGGETSVCVTPPKSINAELVVATLDPNNNISVVKYLDEIICQTGLLVLPNRIKYYSRIFKPMISLLDTIETTPMYLYNTIPQYEMNNILVDKTYDQIQSILYNDPDNLTINNYIFSNISDYKTNITNILNTECNICYPFQMKCLYVN